MRQQASRNYGDVVTNGMRIRVPTAQARLKHHELWLPMASESKRILAVASGGGHWVQLLRLRPAFRAHRVTYVTVDSCYRMDVAGQRFYAVNDATRWNKFGLVLLAFRLAVIVLRERPQVVISTGAAPGFLALRLAKVMGARTVWIDSLANAEKLSLSGQRIGKHADLWLTQWRHLARSAGPHYEGAVL